MTVHEAEIARIARLAELAVDPAELPRLTAQLDQILGFVSQLAELVPPEGELPSEGTAGTPLREDAVMPAAMEREPEFIAPEFRDGFFLVPRLEAMEGA